MNNDLDNSKSGLRVTDIHRYTDAPEADCVVLGVEASEQQMRLVFPRDEASQAAAGIIDGLAELGDPLAVRLQRVIVEGEGGHGAHE